ncbi:MAG: hypothetical protein IKZ59_07875 [Clostridia bacterium]|nr:hypothetical protein [Clostridia bacterium]
MDKKMNIDKQILLKAIVNASGKKINKNAVDSAKKGDISALVNTLSAEDRKKLGAALSNKDEARRILATSKAKEILKNLSGGKDNG